MVDTYGFDVAFACTLEAINAQLRANLSRTDLTVTYSGQDSTDRATVTLNGKWEPWQMIAGGSNRLLRFSVPFKSGTLVIDCPAIGKSNATYQLDQVSVQVELQLAWLDDGGATGTGSGANNKLVFSLVSKGMSTGDTTSGAVSPYGVTDPANHLDELAHEILEDVIADVLIANRNKTSHIFATIETNSQEDAPWLTPIRWDYFYQQPDSGAPVLCVLAVLSDRPLPTAAFDSSVLAAGGNTFIVVSNLMFLTHGVLPGLPAVYGGGTFAVEKSSDSTGSIVNQGSINTATTSWGADTYYPHIDSFSLSISGSNVITRIAGACDITGLAGAYITFSGTETATSNYSPNSQLLTFGAPTGSITSEKHIAWYDYLFGALSGGLGLVIIDTVITAVTATVTDGVGKAVQQTGTTALGGLVVSMCKWSGSNTTQIAGGLSSAFWIAGNSS